MSEKRWYLVSYDIRSAKRWRAVHKKLAGRGECLQYSLFRCRLTETEKEALRWELEKFLDADDDMMFVHLCEECASRTIQRGRRVREWTPPKKRHEIL
jgi:CRISPR-associated endoribonuclease Cas2